MVTTVFDKKEISKDGENEMVMVVKAAAGQLVSRVQWQSHQGHQSSMAMHPHVKHCIDIVHAISTFHRL